MTILRSTSAIKLDTGEDLAVYAEGSDRVFDPFFFVANPGSVVGSSVLAEISQRPYCRVQRTGTFQSYGYGTRLLWTRTTCRRKGSCCNEAPVIVLSSDGVRGARPLQASLLESVADPTIFYDSEVGQYHLYYWVNGWSPRGNPTIPNPGESLFPGSTSTLSYDDVSPSGLTGDPIPAEDDDYRYTSPPSPPGFDETFPPPKNFTSIKDVPEASSGYPELGPFDLSRFWVAPWTDSHRYRVVDTDPNNLFQAAGGDSFTVPQTPIVLGVKTALAEDAANRTDAQQATLDEYVNSGVRLGRLTRTTRVLMYTRGWVISGFERPGSATNSSEDGEVMPWLVVQQPTPVMAFVRGCSKMIATRQKWTSFMDGNSLFVTAPKNYRHVAAVSTNFTAGMPIVDFVMHSPWHQFNSITRAASIPETDVSQNAPFVVASLLIFPLLPTFVTAAGALTGLSIYDDYSKL